MKNKIYTLFLFVLSSLILPLGAQTFSFAKKIGGSGEDGAYKIDIDGAGNIYTAGRFKDSADFDPGPGTYYLSPTGYTGAFISKYDPMGNLLWARQLEGLTFISIFDMTVDNAGNVYTTGNFELSADFDPGSGVHTINSVGDEDIFISKLDPSGNFVWAKNFGGSGYYNTGQAIEVDPAGNVYTSGRFHSPTDFDPGAGSYTLTSAGNADIFLSKLDAAGNFIWAKRYGGTSEDQALAMSLDNLSNVYITGNAGDSISFGSFTTGDGSLFVAKIDPAGNTVWASGVNGAIVGLAITNDNLNNSYVAGFFNTTSFFDSDTIYPNTPGEADIYLAKYDALGNFVWVKSASSIGDDYSYGLETDVSGNIYVTGNYVTDMTFNSTVLSSAGLVNDIFIAKYDTNGNILWTTGVGGDGDDFGSSLAKNPTGDIFLSGHYSSTSISFGSTTLSNSGLTDGFFARLTATTTAGIHSVQTEREILIFPNPTDAYLTVDLAMFSKEKATVSIYNALGEKLLEKALSKETRKENFDLSAFSKGIYLLNVIAGNVTVTKRVIVK
jgi:hypothetical protein